MSQCLSAVTLYISISNSVCSCMHVLSHLICPVCMLFHISWVVFCSYSPKICNLSASQISLLLLVECPGLATQQLFQDSVCHCCLVWKLQLASHLHGQVNKWHQNDFPLQKQGNCLQKQLRTKVRAYKFSCNPKRKNRFLFVHHFPDSQQVTCHLIIYSSFLA